MLLDIANYMPGLTKKLYINDLLRILQVLKPKMRRKIYGIFLLMFVVAIFEVLSILSMTFTAMSVAAPHVLLESRPIKTIFLFFPGLEALCSDLRYFTLVASLAVVILTALKNFLSALLFWRQSAVGEDVAISAGDTIMNNYLNNSYMWHISSDSNSTIMALGGRSSLSQFLMNILTVYTYAVTSIALVFILVSATPVMIIGVLLLTALVSWSVYRAMKKKLDQSGEIVVQAASNEGRAMQNAMHGIREVLIYRQQPVFRQKFLDACRMGIRARTFLGIAPPIPAWVLEVYGFAAIPFTTWVLIYFYNADMALIAGVVTMVMLCAWRILPLLNRSLSSLVVLRSTGPMAMLCLNRLEAIRDEHIEQLPEPDPSFNFNKAIDLKDIDFKYPKAGGNALEKISLQIPKGKQIGLVGISGSGKSTLAGIIAGLLEPSGGVFTVDGKPLAPAGLSAYRSRIGYVPQTPYLMAGTIAENVAFSEWGKPYDPERVRKACEMAALDIALQNEDSILYQIGENGAGLSGGQAQRVSIARALYANPEILIMDESTSALDQQTEAAIMTTINGLKNSLTMIIIAHRLSTVEKCDWIIWMENGNVRMQGETAKVLENYRLTLHV